MYIFFADDSNRRSPNLPDMGALIAIGGIFVETSKLKSLNQKIEVICTQYGFPQNDPFKWSPGRELWMRENLTGDRRRDFFLALLTEAKTHGAGAIVVIEDTTRNTATDAKTPQIDVIRLFFERVDWKLNRLRSEGMLIIDRPSGDRGDEDKFLYSCLETMRQGTQYVNMEHIVLSACSPSKFTRMLQLSDLVTSCSLAAASGERQYSPLVFESIKRILCDDSGRIGGVGFKMHPDYCYVNLYHWLLGDPHYHRCNTGYPLPMEGRPYINNPYISLADVAQKESV